MAIHHESAIDFVWGDVLDNHAPGLEAFDQEHFIYSVWPFYTSKRKFARLETLGIHGYTNHNGPVMLDSGGFQLYRKQASLEPEDTLRMYDAASMGGKDLAIALDICPNPADPPIVRMAKIRKTNENFLAMHAVEPRVLHVIHGWTRAEIEASMQPIINGNVDVLAMPSCLTMFTMNIALDELLRDNTLKDLIIKRFLIFLDILREHKLDGCKIHVLGASSGNSSHLLWYAGMDQMDSSNWRIKAAFGKIAFPEKTEVKISKRESNFGASGWKGAYDVMLMECACPVCKGLSLGERKAILERSFQARAVHNAHVYLEERQIAKDHVGTGAGYREYLEGRFAKSYFWRKFLRKVDEGRHQKALDSFLKVDA